MIVRPLEDKDVTHIKDRPGQFLGAHRSRLEIEQEVLKNLMATYYVAEEDGVFLGYIGLWLHEESAEIVTLYVNEEARFKGVGKTLLEAALSRLREVNITTITLEVSEQNVGAIHLYERMGFKVVATRRQYYQDGSNALLMMKEDTHEHTRH